MQAATRLQLELGSIRIRLLVCKSLNRKDLYKSCRIRYFCKLLILKGIPRSPGFRVAPKPFVGLPTYTMVFYIQKGKLLITKDLQIERSEEFIRKGKVSATALLSVIRKYTENWPDRFGRDKYRVFIKKVVEAFEVLGISLTPSDPVSYEAQKDVSHNEQ